MDMRDKYAISAGTGHPARRCSGQRQPLRRAAYVFMAVLGAVATPPALAGDARVAACDAMETATVLRPAAEPARAARAHWLERGLIQWPGVAVEGRFRLYRSATAALRIQPGRAVAGADSHIELAPVKAEMTSTLAERFRHLGDGPRFAPMGTVDLAALLREQVLLVPEDEQGRAMQATALQTPGALGEG